MSKKDLMDYSNDTPSRLWITQPDEHFDHLLIRCSNCGTELNPNYSIPFKTDQGGLCTPCATKDVSDHPMTPTYLDWLQSGDPRWWSSWLCNCKGCAPWPTY